MCDGSGKQVQYWATVTSYWREADNFKFLWSTVHPHQTSQFPGAWFLCAYRQVIRTSSISAYRLSEDHGQSQYLMSQKLWLMPHSSYIWKPGQELNLHRYNWKVLGAICTNSLSSHEVNLAIIHFIIFIWYSFNTFTLTFNLSFSFNFKKNIILSY